VAITSTQASKHLSLAIVFLISRRCNLQCTYCNVEASPRLRTSLDPRLFESWVSVVGELGDLDLGIQLHGGEPLLLDPPVELLAAIARNALVRYPSSAMGTIAIVTNGTLVDAARARSLVDAGLRVVVSVDGPQHIHDRHRVMGSGRGSHRQAMQGLAALRSVDPDAGVIAVVSEPSDVADVVKFFMSEGLSCMKINPLRPEGRGATVRGDDGMAHMVALADAYFDAALTIAAHNQRRPEQPIYEENIAVLLARAISGRAPRAGVASWTVLIDERGRLWSHPGGYGVEHMALTTEQLPSLELLSKALGVAGDDRAERVMFRQWETLRPCAGCIDPMWCTRFRPLVGGPAVSADCVWRDRLMSRLKTWWEESPISAISVLPFDSVDTSSPPPELLSGNGSNDAALRIDGPIEPAVGALLAGIRVAPDGHAYVDNFANRVIEICGLDPFSNASTFLQLATLARGYAGMRDRFVLARCLARLARVGLEPLARRAGDAFSTQQAPPGSIV
jgi:sulfatase maturation enzyme AslB (radical SAM superfamily)